MQYGICNLSIIPLRNDADSTSEMVSQLLYGELYKVIDVKKDWCKVRTAFDKYEGWISKNQCFNISETDYKLLIAEKPKLAHDLVEFIQEENNRLYPILLGATLNGLTLLNHSFDGTIISPKKQKSNIINTAYLYLNAPYLWGGKTPFGIDCSGFTQMVYKLNGYSLLRDAAQQCTQGEALSFIEESEPGDLAFFDNNEGSIIHVGIIMKDHFIIHAHGKVRIDRIDHTGIYNIDTKTHSHKLRVIKKII